MSTTAPTWLERLEAKEGFGSCICEGQEIAAACSEIRSLRAEVSRLTAELSELRAQKQTCDDKEIVANDDGSALLHAIEAQKGMS